MAAKKKSAAKKTAAKAKSKAPANHKGALRRPPVTRARPRPENRAFPAGKGGGRAPYYDDCYCEEVIKFMATGATIVEFASAVGVLVDTISDWRKRHPQFDVAVRRGMEASQRWWERRGREGIDEPGFNANVWRYWMGNRFRKHWGDRQELVHSGNVLEGLLNSVRDRNQQARDGEDS